MKDLSVILSLGRNSPRESGSSCFPPVCHCYSSFTCSLVAEPKTIGERARGPSECWLFPALTTRLGRGALIETMLFRPKGSS